MLNKNLQQGLERLRQSHVLVTGGAGFIGSNIVGFLIENGIRVTVLDNLSTGHASNLNEFKNNALFSFIEGDITDYKTCLQSVEGIDVVCHQAALGSVPRSIEFPHNTHQVNATGFLNMLHAVKEKGIQRFVYASSSSVYGDSQISPKNIGNEGELLSPYAVTKKLNEEYAKVYFKLHNLQTIGLRYFNVFGPKQDPNGVYAAAIPKFMDKMISGDTITIHGDGGQTRDFTYVQNAVKANILGMTTENQKAFGRSFNVACGEFFSLNDVVQEIKSNLIKRESYNANCTIVNGPDRPGDIRDSLANIQLTTEFLDYDEPILFKEGMELYCDWLALNNKLQQV